MRDLLPVLRLLGALMVMFGVSIVVNPDYASRNNSSSIKRVEDRLARARVAHDGTDLVALLGGIAVVAAFLAACFVGHGSAALGAQDAVVVDGLARGAERLAGKARFSLEHEPEALASFCTAARSRKLRWSCSGYFPATRSCNATIGKLI